MAEMYTLLLEVRLKGYQDDNPHGATFFIEDIEVRILI